MRELLRRVGDLRPPGPFRRTFWKSPLRGMWLTSFLGLVLLIGLTTLFVTGLVSYAAYKPRLGGQFNDPTPGAGILGFYIFEWPTDPPWLYQLNQGIHVVLGLALVPVVLAKLWSVIPKFFAWPPVESPAQALERASLFLLVGGAFFEFITGIINIQYWYAFPVGFYTAHFYGAWVFVGALFVHVVVRFGRMVKALRGQRWRDLLGGGPAGTRPEPPDEQGLAPVEPAPATLSRRGLLGVVGGSSLLLVVMSIGQSIGGPLRQVALLAPRGGWTEGPGPNDFVINKTAAARGIRAEDVGPAWRLELRGPGSTDPIVLDRGQLLAMALHTERIPLACVEGWSTVQTWTGVRLKDLAALAGVERPSSVHVESLQRTGAFRSANLGGNQVMDERSLLALRVNGADLSLDHGFPARIIVPNNPGVHNTKWVARLTFRA
ncbi:MAG TPA: molybdopterin-dependent oxidoreductase [Actinopolymorphaceae bacterium]